MKLMIKFQCSNPYYMSEANHLLEIFKLFHKAVEIDEHKILLKHLQPGLKPTDGTGCRVICAYTSSVSGSAWMPKKQQQLQ